MVLLDICESLPTAERVYTKGNKNVHKLYHFIIAKGKIIKTSKHKLAK